MFAAEVERLLVHGELFLEGKGNALRPLAIHFHRGVLVQRLGQAEDDLQAGIQVDRSGFFLFYVFECEDFRFDGHSFIIGFFLGGFGPVPGVGERLQLGHVYTFVYVMLRDV